MRPEQPLPASGVRTVPRVPEENYWYRRHLAAYRLAAGLAHGRILDAGAGEGYGTVALRRRGWVAALELDDVAVAHGARRYPWTAFVRADLCRLPVRAASIDAVVALQVLEHLWCPAEFLAVCRRSLRPGGVLIVSTPNRPTFPAGLNPSHVHEYDTAELRGLMAVHFHDVQILGIDYRLPLRLTERLLGEDLQRRLVRDGYRALPRWLRAALRTTRSRHFRMAAPDRSLDLVAIGRVR